LTYLGAQCLRAASAALREDPLSAALDDGAEGRETEDAGPAATPSRQTIRPTSRRTGPASAAYATGLLMTLLNPMTLAFWFTVVPAIGAGVAGGPPPSAARPGAVRGTGEPAPSHAADLPMLCAGVFIGTVAWVVVFAGLLAGAGRAAGRSAARRRRWLAGADAVGGVALLFFAALAAFEFWRRLGPLL
jgi:threonine/homoserine/homoserine lactone efflux protein